MESFVSSELDPIGSNLEFGSNFEKAIFEKHVVITARS